MSRMISREQEKIISKKENKTAEEKIYLKFAKFENEQEEKTLFTKSQFNMAVIKSAELLAGVIKNKITKGILSKLLMEINPKEANEIITNEQVEKIAFEIIKKVREAR